MKTNNLGDFTACPMALDLLHPEVVSVASLTFRAHMFHSKYTIQGGPI
jgi:hypothetical protein